LSKAILHIIIHIFNIRNIALPMADESLYVFIRWIIHGGFIGINKLMKWLFYYYDK